MQKLPKMKSPRRPRPLPKSVRKTAKPKPIQTPASSHIENHAYNPETGHLDVTFRGGRKYRYDGVSTETAKGLADTSSAGTYLHQHVIGKHDATKL